MTIIVTFQLECADLESNTLRKYLLKNAPTMIDTSNIGLGIWLRSSLQPLPSCIASCHPDNPDLWLNKNEVCAPRHCYNCEPSSVHQEPEEWVQLSPGRPRDGTCIVCDFFGYLILMILVILVIVVILMVRRRILRGKRIARGPAASPGVVIARAGSVHL